jgi:hypothetical protein
VVTFTSLPLSLQGKTAFAPLEVGPRAGLNMVVKRKIPSPSPPPQEIEPPKIQARYLMKHRDEFTCIFHNGTFFVQNKIADHFVGRKLSRGITVKDF